LHQNQTQELKRKERELKSRAVLTRILGTTNKVETISKAVKTVLKVKMDQEETVRRDKVVIKETDLQDKVVKTVRVVLKVTDLRDKVVKTVLKDKVVETVSETTDRDREPCLLS